MQKSTFYFKKTTCFWFHCNTGMFSLSSFPYKHIFVNSYAKSNSFTQFPYTGGSHPHLFHLDHTPEFHTWLFNCLIGVYLRWLTDISRQTSTQSSHPTLQIASSYSFISANSTLFKTRTAGVILDASLFSIPNLLNQRILLTLSLQQIQHLSTSQHLYFHNIIQIPSSHGIIAHNLSSSFSVCHPSSSLISFFFLSPMPIKFLKAKVYLSRYTSNDVTLPTPKS